MPEGGQSTFVGLKGDTFTSKMERIGSGGYGEIIIGCRQKDNLQVAIKRSFCKFNTPFDEKEQEVMLALKEVGWNDNIMNLVDIVTSTVAQIKTKHIAAELLDMDLGAFLEGYPHYGAVPEGLRLEISRQLFHGLDFLHRNGVAHYDLTEDNVLLDLRHGLVKIGDFGCATFLSDGGAAAAADDTLRVMDLREAARKIVTLLYLGRGYGECWSATSAVFKGASNKRALEVVFQNPHILKCLRASQDWWEKLDTSVKDAVLAVNKYTLQHPPPGGVPAPDSVVAIVAICMLFVPYAQATAANVAAQFDALIPPEDREKALRTARHRAGA